MKKNLITLAMVVAIPAFSIAMAMAQQVPALENVSFAPGSYLPIPTAKPLPRVQIESAEAPVDSLSSSSNTGKPTLPSGAMFGHDSSVVFNYGENLPSVVCAPLHVCEVSLQPGETIQQLDVGDTTRWLVKLARSRNADGVETSHLIIKPADVGIASNLVAITDKRTYSLQLVSRRDHSWMPKVAFSYPDDIQANWQAYFAQNKQEKSQSVNLVSTTPSPGITPVLDFKYHLKGDKPAWKPVRVYSDQNKTYIQLPATAKNDEIPVLLVLGPGNAEQLVNYRLDGDSFVVDKVIQRATLISGIGKNQQRVDIVKAGS
jgi:P-type conjugative transfer protein TrbG